jgi:hypothetical protein
VVGFQNQFWAVIKDRNTTVWGGSLIFLNNQRFRVFKQPKPENCRFQVFQNLTGFHERTGISQQQLSRQLFDFFKKKLSIVECQFTLKKAAHVRACLMFGGKPGI